MNDRTSTIRRLSLSLLAIFAFVIASLLVTTPASTQRREEGRGADLRPVSSLPSKDKRWALIIGVDNYGLQGAVNDARALRNALIRYAGFPENQIISLTTDDANSQPNRNNILSELDRLSRSVPADGLLLFSFSGHGKTIGDDAYLIPSDGRMTDNKRLLRDFSIDVTRVREAIEDIKVKQVIMLIDSCRTKVEGRGEGAEPLTPAMRRGFSFDEKNKEIEAFITLYATKLDERAYEYYDRETNQWRGYFSKAIEEGLSGKAANEKGEVTFASLVKYMEDTVPARSYRIEGIRQVPWKTSNGYKESELVLAVAPRIPIPTSPARWDRFSKLAKILSEYDYVHQFSDALAPVRLNDKWGFIDKSGNAVTPLKYDQAYIFSEGFAPVSLNKKWGFVDNRGKEVVPPKYDQAYSFSEGLAAVMLNEKWGYIDKTGRVVIALKYEDVRQSSEGLLGVKLNDKFGFIDRTGKVVIPFKYNDITKFSGGLAAVSLEYGYNFIDKSGNVAVPAEHDNAGEFSEGFVEVGIESDHKPTDNDMVEVIYKWGFMNTRGSKITELEYDETDAFSEGLAVVVKDGKQGFIDKSGAEVIPLRYDVDRCGCERSSFAEGLAQIVLNGKYGFVNTRGREVIPPKYDNVWCDAFRKEGFIGVELKGRKGFVDTEGNEYFNL